MDTTGKDLKELRRLVGIVFQYPEHQLLRRPFTKILLWLRRRNITEEEAREEILKLWKSSLSEDILRSRLLSCRAAKRGESR